MLSLRHNHTRTLFPELSAFALCALRSGETSPKLAVISSERRREESCETARGLADQVGDGEENDRGAHDLDPELGAFVEEHGAEAHEDGGDEEEARSPSARSRSKRDTCSIQFHIGGGS